MNLELTNAQQQEIIDANPFVRECADCEKKAIVKATVAFETDDEVGFDLMFGSDADFCECGSSNVTLYLAIQSGR